MNKNIYRSFFFFLLVISSYAFAEPFIKRNDFILQKNVTPFRSPTSRFLDLQNYSTIQANLKNQGVNIQKMPFYEAVMTQEDRGMMGYHASGHEFRIFQDIVRLVLEEKLDMEFPEDFHFFRIPGDAHTKDFSSAYEFILRQGTVNDNLPEQRDQLISMNFSLYNNHDHKYECSIVFFELAHSFKPPNFEKKIGDLFDALGMPKDKIPELIAIGDILWGGYGGALFQFFDTSYQYPNKKLPYQLMDTFAYYSVKKGVPIYPGILFSDLLQATYSTLFFDQFRLVINNAHTLNPYDSLMIKRYDLSHWRDVKNYEKQLRNAIRQIPHKQVEASHYKMKLFQYWGLR
jgi:hypothetical protein